MEILKSTCGLCQAGCGVLIYKDGDEIVKIEGDPESPVNRGALCVKALASLDHLHHPDRLKYPLKRAGERGSGKWQRISWDEALDIVAEEFAKAKAKYGPESLVFIRGAFKGGLHDGYLTRFANAFGCPNIASMAPVCYVPRANAAVITHGFVPVPDYEFPPSCIVIWGANMAETRIGEHEYAMRALQKGARLMVIDPRRTDLAKRADLWVQPRPGSDLALALGMINVIINEGLFDEDFVKNWTVGFEELKEHVQAYSPRAVEEITWVKASLIEEAARFYATNRPACIQWGNALDHNLNSFQTGRALSILRAITGNLGIPGGEVQCSPPGVLPITSPEFDLRDRISPEDRQKRISAKSGLFPLAYYALPQDIVKAILEGDPYPLRVVYLQGGNILLSYSNAKETYRALKEVDFLAVADLFMTPTAALADIVLPVGTYLEFDNIVAPPYYPVAQVQQKVAQVGECRSDYDIVKGLADRLDLGELFWESQEECLNYVLKPAGLTFEEFKRIGVLVGRKEYRRHERDGFPTPSGKVELYSERLKEWGFDPIPIYRELPETPRSDPDLAEEFPLIFTSWKSGPFRHSGGRQIKALRGLHPEPVVWIHPETAAKLGIEDGDWVYVETRRGRIRQKAKLTEDIAPRVVGVDYAWWFPEKGPEAQFGWAESNVNILTDNKGPFSREMGTANLRGIACRVYKE